MTNKQSKIKSLAILLMLIIIPLVTILPRERVVNNGYYEENYSESDPQLNLPSPTSEWWNKSWEFRIPLEIQADGNQQDAPVELYINFTEYFEDLNVADPILNTISIRIIEYLSSSNYYEVESQFDPYSRSYDSGTNAIGDLIWILNGTTINNQIRNFYIYFNNGSNPIVPDPNYDVIRLWHEGFEEYRAGDILRPTDGQDRIDVPPRWEISNTTSSRGSSSLHIWGNNWKASATGVINIDPDTVITAKMRFDDPPTISREISGLGFRTGYASIPSSTNSYNIRGSQSWGSAGSYKFRNQYYADSEFFWYTFNVDSEISLSSFDHIFYVADDDGWTNRDLYWDDISIWAKSVQTTPNNSLLTTFGDIEPISFTLKISCKDEDGKAVQNAHIYLSNALIPSLNQDNVTDENGEWTFSEIANNGIYNITINYTQNGLSNPKTASVYTYENFPIINLNSKLTAFLTLTEIEFNITDKDDDPINHGFVILKNGTQDVGKSILSDSGTGSITWINDTSYDYEVYYDYETLTDNSHYRYPNILIHSEAVLTDDIDATTEVTKITFNVTDDTAQMIPFTNAKLRFYNTSDYDSESEIIANVTVDINGLAQFISFSNTSGTWGNYTVDIFFGGAEQSFIADGTPISSPDGYEFILESEDYVKIEIPLNKDEWNSTISIIDYTSNLEWGNTGYIHFNFSKQDQSFPMPTLVTPGELFIQIFDEELTQYSTPVDILSSEISSGIFNYTFDSFDFNLIGGNLYYLNIIGNYKSYVFNDIGYKPIAIHAIETGIKYYNYSLSELTEKRVSVVYAETVNIVVDFFNNNTITSLPGASISYSWDYGSGVFIDDPIHTGLYYFEFDSTSAPNDAEYIIDIIAILTNYSTITDSIIMKILPRPTSINGTTSLFQISPKVYVLDAVNYLFEYEDALTSTVLGDLEVASYNWYRLDQDGNPLVGPGNEGSGDLVETVNNRYMLDFNTESREVGEYSVFITLQKSNYEVRNAFISLTISKRPIAVIFETNNKIIIGNNRTNVVQGDPINFKITLYDPTNGSQLLSSANVTLTLGLKDFDMIEISNGVYQYDYSTSGIEAFIAPVTLTGQITIQKENYEVNPTVVTVIVGMTEIFGFPMFYFLLIIGGVAAIVVSLVGYRVIQQARIPKFVKKVRKMKGAIKSKKTISDSMTYPSKNEFIVGKLKDRWDLIGLSLGDTLEKGSKGINKTYDDSKKKGDLG
ncbi:MAG: hypothetical protein ACW990_06270 [Promethearchaeota archaeon]|jgi:hypothetical protein